jgi:hypothetical protein
MQNGGLATVRRFFAEKFSRKGTKAQKLFRAEFF